MSKARVLADFISDGSTFADGAISVAEVSGAAPLASPTFTGNVDLGDDVKLRLGDSDDLQLYHDSAAGHSIIKDAGTGNLNLLADNFRVGNAAWDKWYFIADNGGAATMFWDGSGRIATAADGVDITGDVGADTATITGTVTAGQYDSTEALPDVRPSLLLDFANSKTLDPRITFTRGSTATYWDGKTTTKAEENLIKRSNTSNTATWGTLTTGNSVTHTINDATAPDGTTTASNIAFGDTSAADNPRFFNDGISNVIPNITGDITFSIYLKANGVNWVKLRFSDSGAFTGAYFDLSTGSIGTVDSGYTAAITSVGNGWYRCAISRTDRKEFIGFSLAEADGDVTWAAGSMSAGNGVYAWGAQVEQRSSATAYTATTDSPIVKYQPTLQTAASGEARFDHDPVTGESKGLLIEEARTNLLPYSEDVSQWTTIGSTTVLTNQVVAPDGTLTADTVDDRDTTNPSLVYAYLSSMTAVANYTASVYLKAGTSTECTFNPYRASTENNLNIDLSNGTFLNEPSSTSGADYVSHSIEDVGNGWYRVSVTFSCDTAGQSIHLRVWPNVRDTHGPTGYVHVWGAQVEEGSFPTSYIPTSGSTVTRSNDNAIISNLDWYSETGGTVLCDAVMNSVYGGTSLFPRYYEFRSANGGTAADSIRMIAGVLSSYTDTRPSVVSFGTIRFSDNTLSETNGQLNALAFENDNFAAAVGGTLYGPDTSGTLTTNIDQLTLGGYGNASTQTSNLHMKKFAFYPKRLSDATLQAMTEA